MTSWCWMSSSAVHQPYFFLARFPRILSSQARLAGQQVSGISLCPLTNTVIAGVHCHTWLIYGAEVLHAWHLIKLLGLKLWWNQWKVGEKLEEISRSELANLRVVMNASNPFNLELCFQRPVPIEWRQSSTVDSVFVRVHLSVLYELERWIDKGNV